jgi:hypothetical protein
VSQNFGLAEEDRVTPLFDRRKRDGEGFVGQSCSLNTKVITNLFKIVSFGTVQIFFCWNFILLEVILSPSSYNLIVCWKNNERIKV